MKAKVIGLGTSGKGAAKLLLKLGYEVIGIDRNPVKIDGVKVYGEDAEVDADLVVLSSGIPRTHPHAKGNVVGEAEFALRHLKNKMVGITGTNGKTTTTLLTCHVLNHAGIKARALGNVGASLAEYAVQSDPDEVLVIELSSFQLETLEMRCLDVGLITNISPDHLDRYPSFESYKKTKLKLKNLVKEGGTFIMQGDSYLQLTTKKGYLQSIGRANVFNAFQICKTFGVSLEEFEKALETFQPPSHRMERVGEFHGVTFINDSKGTNIDATLYGVNQIDRPIHLIAGGQSKGTSFLKWKDSFPDRVKRIYTIGETAPLIEKEMRNQFEVERCETLKEAVHRAKQMAKSGEIVLFSPGCASFDQFKNFEERGNMFKEYIKEDRKSE